MHFITKNKKEYAYIQAIDNSEFKHTKHYYIKSGGTKNAVAQRINWKTKSTGKLWWKKKRLVATIPKASFDKFQLVIIEEPPCSGCKDDILKKDTNVLTYKVLQPMFVQVCGGCHGPVPTKGLRLTDFASAMKGSENGLL